ncbi:MAG: hypothetical protein ORN29_05005 [Rhodoferax sp.]|nr:hypothetical protein [Rhodoferax sp.]
MIGLFRKQRFIPFTVSTWKAAAYALAPQACRIMTCQHGLQMRSHPILGMQRGCIHTRFNVVLIVINQVAVATLAIGPENPVQLRITGREKKRCKDSAVNLIELATAHLISSTELHCRQAQPNRHFCLLSH